MNVKIQGGGSGVYANTGSSFGAMQYLNHENKERLAENKPIEPFFSHQDEEMFFGTMIELLDQNKAKLGSNEAKFFSITISPSMKELETMGGTEQEQSQNMKGFVRETMDEYAQNFGKGLRGEDLLYFAKIHHNRGQEEGMHAHVIVSRKSKNNKVRLSPKTNHRQKSGKINGFDRTNFFRRTEDRFDISFDYKRETKETFDYQNTLKNGTVEEIKQGIREEKQTPFKPLLDKLEKERDKQIQDQKEFNKVLSRENNQDKKQRLEQRPKIEKELLKEFEEELKSPKKTQNRGFRMGF